MSGTNQDDLEADPGVLIVTCCVDISPVLDFIRDYKIARVDNTTL